MPSTQRSTGTGTGPAGEAAAVMATADDDRWLLEALRRGDEAAFVGLVTRLHGSLLRVAMGYVPSRAVAEEVVQETWLAVLQQLDRFEGRSSLKTWIFQILSNRAKTRAVQERRSVPFSSLGEQSGQADEPVVDPDRFFGPDHRWAHHWASPPRSWQDVPEQRLLSKETRAHVERAIDALPAAQRTVITLRDVQGWASDEVCELLGLTEGNQRVLLHRARAKVRQALESYLAEDAMSR